MTYVRFYIALMIAAVAMALPQDVQGMDFPHGLKRLASNESFNPRPLKKIKEGEGEMDCDAPQPYFEVTIKGQILTNKSTEANLCASHLWNFPPEICNLTGLTTLSMSGNNLTTIPPEIGNLTELTDLALYNNVLTTLPSEIGNLTRLKSLKLSCNKLTTFPSEIGNLIALEILNLEGNPLRGRKADWAKYIGKYELNSFRSFCTPKIKIQMVLLAYQHDQASFLATLFPDLIKLICRMFLDQHYLSEPQEALN